MIGTLTAALFAVMAAASVALAQPAGHIGQWACQMTYTELDRQGNRTSGFTRDYRMAVRADGSFEAIGSIAGAAGYHQFRSRGTWQSQGPSMIARGLEQTSDPWQMPGIDFVFTGTLQSDGTISYRYEQLDPYQQYVMVRTLYYCERRA